MLLNELPLEMARCLALTIALEGTLGFVLGVRSVRGQAVLLLANVLTNPLVVSLNVTCTFLFGRVGYWASIAVLESAAFAAEALVYRQNPPCGRNPFLLSAALNACSLGAGWIIRYFTH